MSEQEYEPYAAHLMIERQYSPPAISLCTVQDGEIIHKITIAVGDVPSVCEDMMQKASRSVQ